MVSLSEKFMKIEDDMTVCDSLGMDNCFERTLWLQTNVEKNVSAFLFITLLLYFKIQFNLYVFKI